MKFTKTTWGFTKNQEIVSLYRLESTRGGYVEFTDLGCRIRSICVPDKNGILTDVCLGLENINDYEADTASLGAAVGRHANRIGGASFTLHGKTYDLEVNNGNNHLHGGSLGFASRMWKGEHQNGKIIFTRRFPDGEDGYPGNLDMKVIYEWTEDHQLRITYFGICDKDTILNVTNHSYFHLDGKEDVSVLDHELKIFSSFITENNEESLPTGKILPVDNTPFDFRDFKTIGQEIEEDHIQLKYGSGYDHNFILDKEGFHKAAILQSNVSGIRMTCHTDQPGIQIYTANFLGGCKGKYGKEFFPRNSVCLETQHFPNATNIPEFPSVILKAGKNYMSTTWYAFDIIH